MLEYEHAATSAYWNAADPPPAPEKPEGKGWRLVGCIPDTCVATSAFETLGVIWYWERPA